MRNWGNYLNSTTKTQPTKQQWFKYSITQINYSVLFSWLNCLNHCLLLKVGEWVIPHEVVWGEGGIPGDERVSLGHSGIQVPKCNELIGWTLSFLRHHESSYVWKTLWKCEFPQDWSIFSPTPHKTMQHSVIDAEMYFWLCFSIQKKKNVFTRSVSSSGYVCSSHHSLCLNLKNVLICAIDCFPTP